MTIYLDGPGEREPLTSGALGLEQMVGSEVGVFSAGWMLPGKGFKPTRLYKNPSGAQEARAEPSCTRHSKKDLHFAVRPRALRKEPPNDSHR
eukprot:1145102-Pelagomonas_calceolata.AAC.4